MNDQYDGIGDRYKAAREAPATKYLEAPSLIREVGPVDGKAVIDFACGDGYFTRVWKRLGAAAVVGVDLSREMIDLARRQEEIDRLGIVYHVADASIRRIIGRFDLATAIFLFNYAEEETVLLKMAENVAGNLAPGGRLVAVVPNPDFVNGRRDTLPYGYYTEEIRAGPSRLEVRMTFTGDAPFSIEFSQWRKPAYEEALARAGFRDVRWTFFSVSDEGTALLGGDFWRATLENPKSVILSAVKA